MPPSQRVSFARTCVVWVPKRPSVTPPPKAAPSPSLRGRCMRTSRMMKRQTITLIVSRALIRYGMAGAEYGGKGEPCKMELLRREVERFRRRMPSRGLRGGITRLLHRAVEVQEFIADLVP